MNYTIKIRRGLLFVLLFAVCLGAGQQLVAATPQEAQPKEVQPQETQPQDALPQSTQSPHNPGPEELVRELYTWFITAELGDYRDDTKGLLTNSFAPATQEAIAAYYRKGYGDVNYISKSQDYWAEWLDVMHIGKALPLSEGVVVVPVSFLWPALDTPKVKRPPLDHSLLVFVQQFPDGWRIIKIAKPDRLLVE